MATGATGAGAVKAGAAFGKSRPDAPRPASISRREIVLGMAKAP
jgi:hypothetical protein